MRRSMSITFHLNFMRFIWPHNYYNCNVSLANDLIDCRQAISWNIKMFGGINEWTLTSLTWIMNWLHCFCHYVNKSNVHGSLALLHWISLWALNCSNDELSCRWNSNTLLQLNSQSWQMYRIFKLPGINVLQPHRLSEFRFPVWSLLKHLGLIAKIVNIKQFEPLLVRGQINTTQTQEWWQ